MTTNVDDIYKFISTTEWFFGSHDQFTPKVVAENLLDVLAKYADLKTPKILVLFNVEFAISLKHTYGVDPSHITLYADHPNKIMYATKMGINHITTLDDHMKFDIIVGNPPFGASDSKGKRKSLSTNLWSRFIDDSIHNWLKDDGYLAMITQSSWAAPTVNLPGKRKILKNIFSVFDTVYISLNKNIEKQFKGVGSTFSYFVVRKRPYGGKTCIEITDDMKLDFDLRLYSSLPSMDHPLAYSINQKYSQKVDKNVIAGQLQSAKIIRYQAEEDETFTHLAYHTPAKGGRYWYTDRPHPNHDKHKVMISICGRYVPVADAGTIGYSDMCLAYIVKPDETLDSAFSVINSKLFHFIVNSNKWNGFVNKEILRKLALSVLDHVYTDDEIYDYFGLDQEEKLFLDHTAM